jgi:hypothetical protein
MEGEPMPRISKKKLEDTAKSVQETVESKEIIRSSPKPEVSIVRQIEIYYKFSLDLFDDISDSELAYLLQKYGSSRKEHKTHDDACKFLTGELAVDYSHLFTRD